SCGCGHPLYPIIHIRDLTMQLEQCETNFAPFPAEVTSRIEAATAATRTAGNVSNPHHPDPSKRGAAQRQVAQPRMAAQGMQLATPGTPVPVQAGPRHRPQGAQQRPLVPQAAIDAHQAHLAAQAMPQAMSSPDAYQEHSNNFDFRVQANSEVEAVSFALPSSFFYYDFKDVYIKPFRGRNFSKLNRAREEESMLHVVE